MYKYEKKYSNNWKIIGSIIVYQSKDFLFSPEVILTEFDDCIIKYMTNAKLYNTRNLYDIELYSDDLINKFKYEFSYGKSIIIISNQINQNKLNIDRIKRKLETVIDIINIPLLCFFITKPNHFMKPHTGIWRLLKSYYKKYNNSKIDNAIVVSNEGGLVQEVKCKNKISEIVVSSDVDRAFANNINCKFFTINEYLGSEIKSKFKWDTKIIPPDIRKLYINELSKIKKPDIFKTLQSFGERDYYIFMIMGAPRSGKTILSNKLVDKWCNSPYNVCNTINILSSNNYTYKKMLKEYKKMVDNRISVIIDGNCYNDILRQPFIDYIKNRNIPILCIEINCGLHMAKLFNHSCIEESNDENILLYNSSMYNIYNDNFNRPIETKNIKYLMYPSEIDEKKNNNAI